MITLRPLLSSLAMVALAVALAACTAAGAAPTGSPGGAEASSGGATGIAGTATAGPTCPVETTPPDPSCAPRPVVGAVVIIRGASGAEVARLTTDSAGAFDANLPAGAYVIEPQAAAGLMGTAAARPVTVHVGAVTTVDLVYDTGIRLPVKAS